MDSSIKRAVRSLLLRINKISEQSVGAVCNRTSHGLPKMAPCAHSMIVRLQTAPTKEDFLLGYFVNMQ